MALTIPCKFCGNPFLIKGRQMFCSVKCAKNAWRIAHQSTVTPRKQTEYYVKQPHKKRKVATVVLGIEIPQLAWDRFLWLRCLIQEIKKQQWLKEGG